MNINEAILNARTFGEIQRVAAGSSSHLSCLGSRYITAEGYEGYVHIDAIASRTLELLKSLHYEFDEIEREQGKLLTDNIERIYSDNSRERFNSTYFTIAITILRELSVGLFERLIFGRKNVEYEWHRYGHWPNINFWCYTRTQFMNRFGFPPEEAVNAEIVPAIEGRPQRWKVLFVEEVRRAQRA